MEDELCPEAREYLEWCDKELVPCMRKFTSHLINCPQCQRQFLLEQRGGLDRVGFDMLRMSADEIVQKARELLGNNP